LYFATLLHDIGKGRGGEHNIKGAKIARKVVSRFNESSEIAKETGWLVLNHSMLSDVAFKKDLEDHSVIRKVSKSIKTIPRLTSLFLLTVTDISAVEQGLWNYWKASLLRELYLKLENQIKNPKEIISLGDRIEKIKLNIVKKSKKISALSLRGFSKIAYPNYWLLQSEKMIILQIENFFLKKKKNFSFIIKKADEKYFFDLILVTKDRSKLFLNLISIFVYDKVSIYEARIFTLDDGTVIDTFKFSIDFNQKFNAIDEERILSSIKEKLDKLGKEQVILIKENPVKKIKIIHTMMDVTIDNQSSSTYTILNVKTNDRPKLLYDISKILIRNKVVISMAKISTNGDFVEDSFHLRSQHGLKIENTSQINNIINEINKQLSENIEDVT
jgi:[protein-PII] uridylyltransferase